MACACRHRAALIGQRLEADRGLAARRSRSVVLRQACTGPLEDGCYQIGPAVGVEMGGQESRRCLRRRKSRSIGAS